MKTLKLNDGTTFSITDDSTATNMTFAAEDFADAQLIVAKLTADNLKHIEIDSVAHSNLTMLSANGIYNGKDVTLTITLSEMSQLEIMSKEITELQEAVAELAAGGNA